MEKRALERQALARSEKIGVQPVDPSPAVARDTRMRRPAGPKNDKNIGVHPVGGVARIRHWAAIAIAASVGTARREYQTPTPSNITAMTECSGHGEGSRLLGND